MEGLRAPAEFMKGMASLDCPGGGCPGYKVICLNIRLQHQKLGFLAYDSACVLVMHNAHTMLKTFLSHKISCIASVQIKGKVGLYCLVCISACDWGIFINYS